VRAPLCLTVAAIQIIRELKQSAHFLTDGVEMESGITHEFETTEFAGITAKIINPYPSMFSVLDMSIMPGSGAPAHISFTEDKLFIVIEGR
jgi:hypothetical protein